MVHLNRRKLMAASLASVLAQSTWAQSLPSTARILVGFPPGSGPDLAARQLGLALTGKLASVAVVENRTGASGNIAVSAALSAAPDGMTLLSNPSGVMTVNPHIFRKLAFSPFTDLTPISTTCRYELALAVGPAVPESVMTLTDFSDWTRQQRQPVAYGSSGGSLYLLGYAFGRSQKLDLIHVPYRGAGPMLVDIQAGQVPAGTGSLPALMAQAGSGKLRVLASTGSARSRFFPSVPTFEEQGVHGLAMREWHGIYVAGKPTLEVIARLVTLVQAAVNLPSFVEAMGKMGFEAAASSPEELDRLARSDSERWGEIVKASGFVQEN
ncbi:MAG: hypothetical protein KJZ98_00155 [Burkholderiaceae bacterium]|nr:hypothetical protein [Burkholderiaceae bacterium]MEB2350353.1 tripartite tricarboxylate transporter substrate-binding protein [Burkholderiaceae bacterium]